MPNQFAGKTGEKDEKSFKRSNKVSKNREILYQEVIIELAIILKNSEVIKFLGEG